MVQESNTPKPPKVRIPRPRILWPLLLLLALFVLFFEFIADVDGGEFPAPTAIPSSTASPSPTTEPSSVPNDATTAQVLEVVDGDTVLILAEGKTFVVRYYGIDAPERGERCFSQATEANRQLVEGQTVRLLTSARDADEYGRLLRYVFLEDGQSVEASLVTQGLARAWREDGSYRDYLVGLEETAQAEGTGCLWSR